MVDHHYFDWTPGGFELESELLLNHVKRVDVIAAYVSYRPCSVQLCRFILIEHAEQRFHYRP